MGYEVQINLQLKFWRNLLITRIKEVFDYRGYINREMIDFIHQCSDRIWTEVASVIEIGNHHEQQHQELILTDLKYLLAQNPLLPSYRVGLNPQISPANDLKWHAFDEGIVSIGSSMNEFTYDNEHPQHQTFIQKFELALKKLCLNLAKQIVVDGEGAKKFITINVINAKSLGSAKKIAFSIANSPLIKTAVAGEDPNWGRLVMGIGKSNEPVDVKKLKIKIGNFLGKMYLSIYNLTDRRNQISVYGDTGNSRETIQKRRAEIISPFEPMRPNTISQFFNRPDWYDSPRQIQLGIQFGI